MNFGIFYCDMIPYLICNPVKKTEAPIGEKGPNMVIESHDGKKGKRSKR